MLLLATVVLLSEDGSVSIVQMPPVRKQPVYFPKLAVLEAKTYPTVITNNYIDITIVRADTHVNSKDE